jgi:predicted DNA-binding protein
MAAFVHRLQVLLDEDRHTRLERESRRTGAPVAALVREAIDRVFPPEQDDRAAAAARLLAAAPMPVEDWDELKRSLRDDLSDPSR